MQIISTRQEFPVISCLLCNFKCISFTFPFFGDEEEGMMRISFTLFCSLLYIYFYFEKTYHRMTCSLRLKFPNNAFYIILYPRGGQILHRCLIAFYTNRRRSMPGDKHVPELFVPNPMRIFLGSTWNIWRRNFCQKHK